MRNSLAILPAILICALGQSLGVAVETPQVAFTTLDSFGNYWQNGGVRISGASAFPQGYEAQAHQFVPSIGGTLSSIELALAYSSWAGPDSQVDVSLSLATGGLPLDNPLLVSGTLTTPTPFGGGGLVSFIPSTPLQLHTGQSYWLTLTPHSDTTASVWCMSYSTASGAYAIASNFGPNPINWVAGFGPNFKAFRVNVVPEPSTLTLIGLGLVVAAMLRRRI